MSMHFDDDIFSTSFKPHKTRKQKQREKRAYTAKSLSSHVSSEYNAFDFAREQQEDRTLQEIWKEAQNGSASSHFFVEDGLLYRRWFPTKQGEAVQQLILPSEHRKSVLTLAHTIPTAGHLGTKKTTCRVQQRFYSPGMTKDIKLFCKSCSECQIKKKTQAS